MYLAGIFLDPPTDAVARYTLAPLLLAGIPLVCAVIFGIVYTRRTRDPLFFVAMLTGVTVYPWLVEPLGDYFVAAWYPVNLDLIGEPFGRPIPWYSLLFYAWFIPVGGLIAYTIAKRGLPARRMIQFVILMGIIELPLEFVGSQFNWIVYYGNHALVWGVPIYCFVQNPGFLAVMAWALVVMLPKVHGWRWVLVPFVLGGCLLGLAILGTFPAYIAIAAGAGPVVGWSAAILSTFMNAALVAACIYAKPLQRLRAERVAAEAGSATSAEAAEQVRS